MRVFSRNVIFIRQNLLEYRQEAAKSIIILKYVIKGIVISSTYGSRLNPIGQTLDRLVLEMWSNMTKNCFKIFVDPIS